MALTEIVVGQIGRAHGIRGEVAVALRTDEPERRFAPGEVLRPENGDGTFPAFTVVRTRQHQGRWLVTFDELADRTAAEAVRGVRLVAEVSEDERPEDENEFYDRQLIGLSVIRANPTPESVGTIVSVLHLPAHDVLEIRTDRGVRMVPFVRDLVPEVDLEQQQVVIADVVGLLDDSEDET